MPRALISLSDKSGLVDFASGLVDLGWEIVSTGGTAEVLRASGLKVKDVSEVTSHPEMMEGRIKTLHPAVHAGILARRDKDADLAELEAQGYELFDLVCVNLYPFEQTVAAGKNFNECLEQIDIGGPTLLRAAAKNNQSVVVVVDPLDYGRVLNTLRSGLVNLELRKELAMKAFKHTAWYDGAISEYFNSENYSKSGVADNLLLRLELVQSLRYGENPDQQPAAFYRLPDAPLGSLPYMKQLHGKELSFNNLTDIQATVLAVSAWERPVCAIIKHGTPCAIGLGLTKTGEDAYLRALETDPQSPFGGIVGLNTVLPVSVANELSKTFLEVVIAPGFTPEALEVLKTKKNLRIIELPIVVGGVSGSEYRDVTGGLLVQPRMSTLFSEEKWKVVSKRQPSPEELEALRNAFRVAAVAKSNTMVLWGRDRSLGIGAGQTSRVFCLRIAGFRHKDNGINDGVLVVAADAFLPALDNVEEAVNLGVTAIIQPGGSVKDDEIIAAVDKYNIAMIFTGRRVFRH